MRLDQHRRPRWIALCCLAASLACFGPARARAQEESVEEAQQRVAMERFLGVLEKNPRRGTALDRVYGYHIERGTQSSSTPPWTRPSRTTLTTSRNGAS